MVIGSMKPHSYPMTSFKAQIIKNAYRAKLLQSFLNSL